MSFVRKQKKNLFLMSNRIHPIKIIISLFCALLFAGCGTGYRNYRYVVLNEADDTGGILLTYSLNGVPEIQHRWLDLYELAEIYERKDVSGSDIWDIETSASMFAVPAIVATNHDVTKMTEELSQRSFWSRPPENQNGNGVYLLRITDNLFVLEKQEYHYYVHNMMDDSLFITSSLLGNVRQRDTLVSGQIAHLGAVEIFTYGEDFRGTNKYIERKLSGISSLTIRYGEDTKNIDLRRLHLFNWRIEREQCTLIVDQSVFE